MKQTTAAIEFGTSKIVCMIAEKGTYDGYNLLGTSVIEYAGYTKKGWVEPKELNYAISSSIREAQKQAGRKIKMIHVGTPAEFTEAVCRKVHLNFGKEKRVTQNDIELLFKRGENFSALKDYSVAHRCPITFMINGERKTMDPVNMMASQISAVVSYVLVDQSFIRSVSHFLNEEGCLVDSCISSSLAQGLSFVPSEIRDRTVILIDIGHRYTALSILKGDGIIYHTTIPVGGMHITRDLAIMLRVKEEVATQLKQRAIYGLSISSDDVYEIMEKGSYRLMRFSASEVMEIINARVEEICDIIKRYLCRSGTILPEYVGIYLTGGTSSMRGIREFMQKQLGRSITLIQPKSTRLNKPDYSSALGVMDLAMDNIAQEEITLWEQVKMVFKK